MLSALLATLTILPIMVLADIKPSPPVKQVLASHQISLDNRQENILVNGVFKDNILLNLSYLNNEIIAPQTINWLDVQRNRIVSFKLNPGESFAYQDTILPQYQDSLVKTSNAHFIHAEGFRSDGYLMGNGVCHLASLMNWTASDAGLHTYAPTNHNFAVIPDIPKEFGVSIYYQPKKGSANSLKNLYITNTLIRPVIFQFDYYSGSLMLSIFEDLST